MKTTVLRELSILHNRYDIHTSLCLPHLEPQVTYIHLGLVSTGYQDNSNQGRVDS